MPSEIYLLKVGMTMTEGNVEKWYVPDGGHVEIGEPIYSLETEKVNMDVEAEQTGIVRHLVEEGATLEPGDVVGWLYLEDEEIPEVLPIPKKNPNVLVVGEDSSTTPEPIRVSTDRSDKTGRPARISASPAARRLAKELGVELETITGTGPGGRVTKDDVEAASALDTPSSGGPANDVLPLTSMRKVIGARMFESLQTTAQLTLTMDVKMSAAINLRTDLNEEWGPQNVHLTFTDLVVQACSKALGKHQRINSFLTDDGIQTNESVNIGIAVALKDGLLVPVVMNTQQKSMKEISLEAAQLADKAKSGSLSLDELNGGTFTVSSLGMYGVDVFTPILNPPQSAILGVGRIYSGIQWQAETPIRTEFMCLSLTWDHRVLDGVPAAEFLSEVRQYLESPHRLLV